MACEIRPLVADEVDQYILLRREALSDSPWAFGSSPGHDRGSDATALRESIARPGYVIFAAWEGPNLVGCSGIIRPTEPKRRHVVEVWGVYVTPQARGQGVAQQLMQAVIACARSWPGVVSVRLSVSDRSTAARALYERIGFTVWGIEPDCIRFEEGGQPGPSEWHMLLTL
ncbi:MAG: GNAT family N-acetyltransferase [Phycisphaeraceae bacterium]|nr:GNAT family N-acetyltransferase [Phycisphaeraceae bacterium]MCW5753776.1 GNAT family N-acetyltransferase [Phycisphaeraceae bacterium]